MGRNDHAKLSDLEKYISWIEKLKNASKTHVIVCQTKRDATVLEIFGCKNVMFPKGKEQDFVYKIVKKKKPVVLLYNTDRKSNEKHERLRSILQEYGVEVNSRFRKLLFTEKNRTVSGVLNMMHRLAGSFSRIRPVIPV